MRKILVLSIFYISLFSFCSTTGKKHSIGVLFDSFNAPRFQKERIYFEEKISELGSSAIIKTADGSAAKQELQAKELVDNGVKALIIIACNVNSAASIVRYANAKGVKVIAYDRLIKNCELDFFCTFDGNKVGEYLAKYALEKVPKGNYILLNGDKADENATVFYNGTMKVLKPQIENGNVKVKYTAYIEGWSGENSNYVASEILEFSRDKIDVIISQYDGLSEGVAKALAKKGVSGEVLVTGQDAEVAACNRILTGEQSMTIYKPVKKMAYDCVDVVFELLNGNTPNISDFTNNGRKDVPTKLFDPISVDVENLKSTVVADGFLTMQEIESYKSN